MAHQSSRNAERKQRQVDKNKDHSWYFFNKFGSCFNQLQAPFTDAKPSSSPSMPFPEQLVSELFDLTKEMFNKEFLQFMDEVGGETFKSGTVKPFPYKSLSEILNLVFVAMLRELVVNCKTSETRIVQSGPFNSAGRNISALVGCIKNLRPLYEVQLLETF